MSIRLKILLIFLLGGALMVGVSSSLLRGRMSASYDAIERRDLLADLGRLQQSLEASAASLMSQTNDWAVWSDMHRYAQKPSEAWAKENMGVNALAPADLSLLMIYSKSGRLLSAASQEKQLGKRVFPDQRYLTLIKKGGRQGQCGIVRTDAGLMMTCWAGIVQSDGQGPVAGTVVLGRLLDETRLAKLRLQTSLSFVFHDSPERPAGLTLGEGLTKPGRIAGSEFWTAYEPSFYHLYYPLQDVFGEEVGLIAFDVPRSAHLQGMLLYEQVRQLILWSALIMTGVIWLVLEFLLVRRLRGFAQQLDVISGSAKWNLRIGIGGRDELGLVATNVNKLLALNQQHIEELSTMTLTDALTGLPNRRAFDGNLAHEYARSRRNGTRLALLLLDVDHFKRYNDDQGHPAGDEVLKALAEVLNGSIRHQTDLAARIGGEEFAVLLPETTPSGAAETAERIRANLLTRHVEHPDSPVSPLVTLSIGLAFADSDTVEDFVARADRELYKAKDGGRNRVSCAMPEPDIMVWQDI